MTCWRVAPTWGRFHSRIGPCQRSEPRQPPQRALGTSRERDPPAAAVRSTNHQSETRQPPQRNSPATRARFADCPRPQPSPLPPLEDPPTVLWVDAVGEADVAVGVTASAVAPPNSAHEQEGRGAPGVCGNRGWGGGDARRSLRERVLPDRSGRVTRSGSSGSDLAAAQTQRPLRLKKSPGSSKLVRPTKRSSPPKNRIWILFFWVGDTPVLGNRNPPSWGASFLGRYLPWVFSALGVTWPRRFLAWALARKEPGDGSPRILEGEEEDHGDDGRKDEAD